MNIGVIGAGNFGGPLAALWAAKGHHVKAAASRPDSPSLAALVEQSNGQIIPTPIEKIADGSDVVLLAVPWPMVPQVLKQVGDLSGTILIDVTNPFKRDYSGLEHGLTSSGAEVIAELAPGARVVKAFNTVGAATLPAPVIDGVATSVLLCSDSPEAMQTVAQLAAEIGFDPVNAGPLQSARYVEPLVMLWRALVEHESSAVAFRILRPL